MTDVPICASVLGVVAFIEELDLPKFFMLVSMGSALLGGLAGIILLPKEEKPYTDDEDARRKRES